MLTRALPLAMVARSAPHSLENFEEPPCQIPDSSGCFGITGAASGFKHGTAVQILAFQAILVSIFSLCIQLMPCVNSFYWFLMALSTGLYMVMYILLFLAALKLKRCEHSYQIPKGLRTLSCLAGLTGCVMTIIVVFEPPPNVVIESKFHYALTIGLGFTLLIFPVFFLFAHARSTRGVKAQQAPD